MCKKSKCGHVKFHDGSTLHNFMQICQCHKQSFCELAQSGNSELEDINFYYNLTFNGFICQLFSGPLRVKDDNDKVQIMYLPNVAPDKKLISYLHLGVMQYLL